MEKFSMISIAIETIIFDLSAYYNIKMDNFKSFGNVGHSCILKNPARWKRSCGITRGFSLTIFKKYDSKATVNIGYAVRNTIPGIGTGNRGSILSGYACPNRPVILRSYCPI
jgi:hypothetical protein